MSFLQNVIPLRLPLEKLTVTGDGKQKFFVPVPQDDLELIEIQGDLRDNGSSLDIQVRELNASRVSQGDVMTAVLSFGALLTASTTSFNAGRTTPSKGFYHTIDIDATGGAPKGLMLTLIFLPRP